MPAVRLVNLNVLKGKSIGLSIQEKLRTPIGGLPPQGKNKDRTDVDNALSSHSMPSMQAYPHESNISGTGSGPVISEHRELPS